MTSTASISKLRWMTWTAPCIAHWAPSRTLLTSWEPILFRAHWANDTDALAAALDAVVAGELPRRARSGGVLKSTLRILRNIAPVLDRAGGGAWADMWRVAPPSPSRSGRFASARVGPDAFQPPVPHSARRGIRQPRVREGGVKPLPITPDLHHVADVR